MNAPIAFNYTKNLTVIFNMATEWLRYKLLLLQLCHLIPNHLHILFHVSHLLRHRLPSFSRWSLLSPPSFSLFMFSMTRYSSNCVSAQQWLIMTRQALNSISVTFVLYTEVLGMPRDTSCNHISPTVGFSLPPSLCILLLSDPLIPSGHQYVNL